MAAPVLASVKIAKNAQLVAVIKYINFEMEGALSSIKISLNLRRFSDMLSQTRATINICLTYNKSLKVFLKITPSALGALGRRFESCRPDHLKTKS